MNARTRLMALLFLPILGFAPGCIVVVGGWSSGARYWTEPETETLNVDAAGVAALEVRTHNGAIQFTGDSVATGGITIKATKKGGGRSVADAEAALAAVEVYAEPADDGVRRIGWRWRDSKRSGWNAQVSFDIVGPATLSLDGETHNGDVHIAGVEGDLALLTHNGGVGIDSAGGRVRARTHNGSIRASCAGPAVSLKTHNGAIIADVSRCQPVAADVSTHNGRVELILGESSSGRLHAWTTNGRIDCDVPVTGARVNRRHITGIVGDGNGSMEVETHNGNIHVRQAGR